MTDKNLLIAKAICQAQIASDAGKGRHLIALKKRADASATKYDYSVKEDFILNALRMIRTSPRGMFNYYCAKEADQNGYPSVLVYFDFSLEGKRYQISFHTPFNKSSKELDSYISSGRKTRWNKNIGGSVNACMALIKYFDI